MSPVSRRTGRRYAAGSHATLDGYKDLKACAGCGERVTLTGKDTRPLWFETNAAGRFAWHFECRQRQIRSTRGRETRMTGGA